MRSLGLAPKYVMLLEVLFGLVRQWLDEANAANEATFRGVAFKELPDSTSPIVPLCDVGALERLGEGTKAR
jgi:hypothetical protein